MTRTLTLPFLLAALAASAQPSFTVADLTPPWGPTDPLYSVEPYIAPGPATAGFTFNPGAFTLGASSQSQTVQPASTPYASSFLTATHANTALTNPSAYSYTRIQADGLYLLGIGSPAYTMVYSNPDRTFALPLNNGTTWTDNWAASYTMSGITVSRTGTTTGAYNGYGTLVLPWGSYQVARIELTQTITDTYMGTPLAESTVSVVSYVSPIYDVALFSSSTVTVADPTGGDDIVSYSTSVSQPNGVGINDRSYAARFDAYPNPASSALSLDLSNIEGLKDIHMVDATGRTMLRTSTADARVELDVEKFPAGVYVVVVTNNEATSTVRVVVQH